MGCFVEINKWVDNLFDMNLNINLFVHGVPMGQKTWGPKGDDQRYISSFYGPKWNAPEIMKIDLMTFGGISYCYYSFIKGQDVYDSQGRAGSYFALTLKVNAFYADVQNVYHILKTAYDKYCVGLCIQEGNGSAKYLLSDFQNIDNQLKELESRILKYVGDFSIGDDLVDLRGITVKAQTGANNFNLHECTKDVAIKAIKQCGKIMVSPWYLSEGAAKTVAQYKEEMQAVTQKAEQEILLQKQTSQQRVDEVIQLSKEQVSSIKKQAQEEISQLKEQNKQQLSQLSEDHDRKVAEIKNSYTDIDKKLQLLKETIHEKEKEISVLRIESRKKDKELQFRDVNIRKLNAKIQELNTKIQELNKHDFGWGEDDGDEEKSSAWYRFLNWFSIQKKMIIVGVVSFFILLFAGLGIWYFCLKPSKRPSENRPCFPFYYYKTKMNELRQFYDELKATNPQDSVSCE